MKVTLYSKHNCVQCTAQKRAFDNAGIMYTEVNVEDDPAALAFIKGTLGYLSAPVVYAASDNDTHVKTWSQFRPDLTKLLREWIDDGE